ncbi:hypothetical protein SAMN05428995_105233 [Loktanella sp. DSM 29012]|nr:hypothetical protein SAMN05428995_105233 [Loktanella sp. DSM 29012]
MWEFEGKKIGVEPDVLITFTVGDPEKRVHLIVESKYRGNPQRVSQWAEQLSAYRQSIDSEVIDPADYVVYMALDGLSSRHISNTDLIADAYANSDIQATEIDNLSFVLIGWMDLVKACASVEPVNSGEQRILDDMTKALNLFGYSFIETPRGLEKLKPLTAGTSTLRALALEEI